MKYGDLIQFRRMERVDGVRASSAGEVGRQLVSTFVMSEGIASHFTRVIFPKLKLDEAQGTKPLLVLGGPGAGKSHLLSVLANLAESSDLVATLPHHEWLTQQGGTKAEAFVGVESVSGRFKVIRAGIRREDPSLREGLMSQIAAYLSACGVPYAFPPASTGYDLGLVFREMMVAFNEFFPGQGLLLVADELHEYQVGRKDTDWLQDLNFLLEMADICRDSAFRCIIGLRKSAIDHAPSHQVEEALSRVKSAFELVSLTSSDLIGVAAERLVPKTPTQKAQVAEHLNRFAKCYGGMVGRMDEFVAAFPIHPDYFEVVGSIPFDGARQVMDVLADAVERLLEKTVPEDAPGLIAYDSHWDQLRNDPLITRLPEVEAVVRCGALLEDRIREVARAADMHLALRLIHALCIQRLLPGEIFSAQGATPAEFRDRLCLYASSVEAGEEDPAEVLAARVKEVLTSIQAEAGEVLSGPVGTQNGYHLRINMLRRFVTPELVLHWINAVPFMMLMLTGGLMLLSHFIHFDHKWFTLCFTVHKTFAALWIIGLPVTVLSWVKVHWQHIRTFLTWGPEDLLWMVQSARSVYSKTAVVPEADRFNTGQKINALLVLIYYVGFSTTGVLMLWKASILFPWYIHTALFCASMGSVGGHLFLALVNPSTRIALAGIFHGWAPIEYIEHHHPLSLPGGSYGHGKTSGPVTFRRALSIPRVEIIILAVTALLAGVGVFVFSLTHLAMIQKTLETVFSQGFVAAIKPDELSTKHKIGETAQSCTKCHSYAGEITNEKCEGCHAVIKERRANGKGYHGILKGDCIQCHKEHLDQAKSIIPLDRKTFDHRLAAFPKDGKHAALECDECHKKKRPSDAPVGYYVGLKYGICTDCHHDPHGAQFKVSCETCHSARGWKGPEMKFVHDEKASFRLLGKHAVLECSKCHKPKLPWSPLASATFKGTPADCAGCHQDPHRKQFTAACSTCHSASGWKKEFLTFDHARDTKFPLLAKHATVDCVKCHKPATPWSALASATFKGLPNGCVDCHKDPHRNQFKVACTTCHSSAGWKKEFQSFDHNRDSKFPLIAKHAEAACSKCHISASPGEALGFANFANLKTGCVDCHQDPHRGQFERNCTRCHAKPATWKVDLLRFNHSTETKYVLAGKHVTLACVKCHTPQLPDGPLSSATFRGLGITCVDCHKVKHPETYGPSCQSCHTLDVWPPKMKGFEHLLKYGLLGKHLSVKCSSCHNENRMSYPLQPGATKYDCYTCHQVNDPHKGTLGTACAKCHSMTGWKGEDLLFDHNTMTRYVLNKDHQNVACAKCHEKGRWKPLNTSCESCHPKFYKKSVPPVTPVKHTL